MNFLNTFIFITSKQLLYRYNHKGYNHICEIWLLPFVVATFFYLFFSVSKTNSTPLRINSVLVILFFWQYFKILLLVISSNLTLTSILLGLFDFGLPTFLGVSIFLTSLFVSQIHYNICVPIIQQLFYILFSIHFI